MAMRLFVSVILCLCLASATHAATRLGLHVTQEELTIWQQRRTDNVNGIGGYTYQTIYQNQILNRANTFKNQSHPGGDGQWVGYTGAGCVPDTTPGPSVTAFKSNGKATGLFMVASAFHFLVTGDTTYAAPVRTELLAQIAQAGTQWSNSSKWCPLQLDGNNVLDTIPWLIRLLWAYDYLKAGNYTALTAGERTSIENWFYDATQMWNQWEVWRVEDGWYKGIFAEPQNFICAGGCPNGPGGPLYYGGPPISDPPYYIFFNQMGDIPALAAMVGALRNDAALMTFAKKFFTAFINLGIYDEGGISDDRRWQDCNPECPRSAWGHAAAMIDWLIFMADPLARRGDTSLYDLTVNTQVRFGSGGPVSLRKILQFKAKLANGTLVRYGTESGAELDACHRLYWNLAGCGIEGGDFYWDFTAALSNLYYQDAEIHTAMSRNWVSGSSYNNCADASQHCFGGNTGLPSVPFMFGNMEGRVNPYGSTQNLGPTLSMTIPTTYSSSAISGSTVTLSGPATDDVGVTGVTWTCPQCPVTSGSATCTPACGAATTSTTWTITNLALPANGLSATVTVIATDGELTAQDALTITRQDTADLLSGLQLHFPFNESEGGTTDDASPNNHTGTLQAGATFGTGQAGNGMVFDGVTGQVTVPSTLTSPATLTLAAWVNLSGGVESGTMINIADAVGLRIDSPNTSRTIKGFYYSGSGYPNLAGTTVFPASGWHHLAHTIDATRQVLYLDGSVVAMGTGVAGGPSYTTGITTTSLGRHPASTIWDFQGTLDDVRVYSRALSEVDMAALVAGDDPVEPVIQITTNSGLDYSVTTATTVLAGTASDSDGTVTSVTLSCVPSCGNPSNTGSATAWSFTVPLAYGRQVVTVTATDDDLQTNVDTITLTRYCPTDLTQELQLLLPLNNSAADTSGDGRTITPTALTYAAGVVGSHAGVFDGSTSQIAVGGLLDTPSTLTLAAWVWITAFPETRADLVSIGDYVNLQPTADALVLWYYSGGETWLSTSATMTLAGGWHHVAAVLMPGEQRLYVDGAAVGTPTTHLPAITYTGQGSTTMIGNNGNGGPGNLQGSLDEVRVYACPQSPAGIQAMEDYAEAATLNVSAPLHLRYVGP